MPSESFHRLSDGDLAAIIAYLHTISPADRLLAGSRVGPLGRVLHVAGFPFLPAELIEHRAVNAAPEPGISITYGEYRATVAGCRVKCTSSRWRIPARSHRRQYRLHGYRRLGIAGTRVFTRRLSTRYCGSSIITDTILGAGGAMFSTRSSVPLMKCSCLPPLAPVS